MNKRILLTGSMMLVFVILSAVVKAQPGTWTVLGSAKVHGHLDHDEIWVTASRGDFTAIKLFVENEGIDFDRVVVHFANGGKEEMEIRNFIAAGGETRVLDLRGGDRIIRKVDFYKRKAKVILYGRR
jgi:hypothetical protein